MVARRVLRWLFTIWAFNIGRAGVLPFWMSIIGVAQGMAQLTPGIEWAVGYCRCGRLYGWGAISGSTRGCNGNRLAIRGGSAGGYTTLVALTFHNFFHAGASHFGVATMEALAKETHKFESRYMDRLVGPCPKTMNLYRARSPIHTRSVVLPADLFQGMEDAVVPPNQAEIISAAAETKASRWLIYRFRETTRFPPHQKTSNGHWKPNCISTAGFSALCWPMRLNRWRL